MSWRFDEAFRALSQNIEDKIFRQEVIEYFKVQKLNTEAFINELSATISRGDYKTCQKQLDLLIKEAEVKKAGAK